MKNEFYQEYRDLFGYYKIITKINPFYKLCFDKKAKDFVVINTDRNEEVCIRFDEFNFNLEKSLQESHVKNAEKIFEMVDEHNREVEQKAKKVLGMLKRGVKFIPTQPNVMEILKKLQKK